jgi:hypothetical protein
MKGIEKKRKEHVQIAFSANLCTSMRFQPQNFSACRSCHTRQSRDQWPASSRISCSSAIGRAPCTGDTGVKDFRLRGAALQLAESGVPEFCSDR